MEKYDRLPAHVQELIVTTVASFWRSSNGAPAPTPEAEYAAAGRTR